MSGSRIGLGRWGEELAVQELLRLGYEIVARNWRCMAGEVDIIARRGPVWAFVEVRTRRGEAFGTPEESITASKRARMQTVAEHYITMHNLWEAKAQLMLVAIDVSRSGQVRRMEIIEVE